MFGIFFSPKLSIEEQSDIQLKYFDLLKFCPKFKSSKKKNKVTFLTFAQLKFFSFLLLQGNWIAQWDTQYKAWFYYNIKTGFFAQLLVGCQDEFLPSDVYLDQASRARPCRLQVPGLGQKSCFIKRLRQRS